MQNVSAGFLYCLMKASCFCNVIEIHLVLSIQYQLTVGSLQLLGVVPQLAQLYEGAMCLCMGY